MIHKNAQKLDPGEQHYCIESPRQGMQLFLRHLPPLTRQTGEVRPVLYVHGATFPSALSIAHRFDGYSWRDALCEAGFDVWGFDFHGYGYSDRYPAMNEAPQANPPLCRTRDASEQLEAVVRFILRWHGLSNLSIISHSWGSMPAGRFAGRHPTRVDRMVLFGAIARRPPRRYEKPPTAPAWRIVTVEDQWARFVEDVPRHEQPVLSRAHFDEWSERYLDTDPDSRRSHPTGVKTPTGPFTDILLPGTAISPMTPLSYRRQSRSSAANGMDSLMTRMRDGYSTLLLRRRSNATSRSAGARICCISKPCATPSIVRASPS